MPDAPCELKAGQVYDKNTVLRPDCAVEAGAVLQFDFANEGPAQAPDPALSALGSPRIKFFDEKPAPSRVLREEFLRGTPMPTPTEIAVEPAAAVQPSMLSSETPSVPAQEPQAHTVQPDPTGPSATDLSKIAESAGGNPMLAFGLAALAVVASGGAGFKLLTKIIDNKAEQALEDKKLAREMAGLQGAQPPPCQAASAKTQADISALQAQVSELTARVAKAERVTGTLNPNFDGADLEDRVVLLEKAFRKKAQE